MDAVATEHSALRAMIASADDAALEAFFARCRHIRREHDAILNPLPRAAEGAD